MSKTLNARCMRRWEVEFKGLCDSKVNPGGVSETCTAISVNTLLQPPIAWLNALLKIWREWTEPHQLMAGHLNLHSGMARIAKSGS